MISQLRTLTASKQEEVNLFYNPPINSRPVLQAAIEIIFNVTITGQKRTKWKGDQRKTRHNSEEKHCPYLVLRKVVIGH